MSSFTRREFTRLWSQVALPDENGCMLWSGLKSAKGYGRVFLGGQYLEAHRLSLRLSAGEPPQRGMHAAHSCTNKHCVAPAHLRWATPAENEADKTHTWGRLTAEQRRAIRADRDRSGDSCAVLARRHGISKSAVWRLIFGQSYRNIENGGRS